jgi:hypothetical protein
MFKATLVLATAASLAVLPALAQNAPSSPLNSGNVDKPSRAVPGEGSVSGGPLNRPDTTGTVAAPPAAAGSGAASSPLNSGNVEQPSRAVPGEGSVSGGPRR